MSNLFRPGFGRASVLLFGLLGLLAGTALGAAKKAPPPPVPPPDYSPHYFFNIDLDPRYQIVGVGALSPEAAPSSDCYCFTYTHDGKLQRIEYQRAGADFPDPFFQVPRIDFDYAPGIEHRWYRDKTGAPLPNLLGIQGEELALNHSGYPTTVTNINASGSHSRDKSGVIQYAHYLDAQNRIVRVRRSGLLGNDIRDNFGLFETRTTYDEQGRRNSYANFDSSGNPLEDEDGVALTRTIYTIDPESTETVQSFFDASGMSIEAKSAGAHEIRRVTDRRGFLLSESYFDSTGAPTLENTTGLHARQYAYDERGNQLSEQFFDTDGKPRDEKPFGYAKVTYAYDEKNRISEKTYFGDDGLPVVLPTLGAARVRQEYDAAGNVVRRQFFDGLGNPSKHVRFQAAAIRIQVEGDTTTISLRDEHDRPTRNPVNGYASLKYKTATDVPLSLTNKYFNLHGRPMGRFRVMVINPHLHQLAQDPTMRRSARYGAGVAGCGALLAMALALRKTHFTKRRRVYVPAPWERLLGWLAIFAVIEGTIRFLITIWWAYVQYKDGELGWGVYAIEVVVILFFLYRLPRMLVTMRVLNIRKEDIHQLIRDFFATTPYKPEWLEVKRTFVTEPLTVRVACYATKLHAYLAFRRHHKEGRELAARLADYIRAHIDEIEVPERSRAIALWYPCVATAYFALAFLAFYTLWQMLYS